MCVCVRERRECVCVCERKERVCVCVRERRERGERVRGESERRERE